MRNGWCIRCAFNRLYFLSLSRAQVPFLYLDHFLISTQTVFVSFEHVYLVLPRPEFCYPNAISCSVVYPSTAKETKYDSERFQKLIRPEHAAS
jgi:hypothetical protein